MEHREPSTRSHADCDPSFRLPVPPQPLKDHPQLPVETIVQQMEALLTAAQLGPEFEELRLLSKNRDRFRT
jgi:hypothetical protein